MKNIVKHNFSAGTINFVPFFNTASMTKWILPKMDLIKCNLKAYFYTILACFSTLTCFKTHKIHTTSTC